MPEEMPALWKMVLELWNTANPDLASEVFTATAEYRHPGMQPIHGSAEIAQWIAAVHAAFPDFGMTLDRVMTDANQFVHCWTCTGTHRGDFMGVPPTGRRVEVHGVTVGHISHGRINEATVFYDRLGFLEQIDAQMGAGAAHDLAAAR